MRNTPRDVAWPAVRRLDSTAHYTADGWILVDDDDNSVKISDGRSVVGMSRRSFSALADWYNRAQELYNAE